MSEGARPKVAAIVTEYRPHSHADVIVGRLIKGYHWRGEHVPARVEVASLYFDQRPPNDIGVGIAKEHEIPVFGTIGEAIALGGSGVQVDGVVIVGEHGDYPHNALGQHLYPRRRFFDAAVSAMVARGKTVPLFTDKHLSYSFADARHMVDTAHRLGIPMLAGSSIPLFWRSPSLDWPLGQPMTAAVGVGYGPAESYEFHTLEGLQSLVERRAGGESGVRAVHDLPRFGAWTETGREFWNDRLIGATFDALGVSRDNFDRDPRGLLRSAFLVEYLDGLKAPVLTFDGPVRTWAFAGEGQNETVAFRFDGDQQPPWRHFSFLVRQIEQMMLTGAAPYPIERTLLTTGILEAAMRSRAAGGVRIETPELAIRYQSPETIADTGIGWTYPEH